MSGRSFPRSGALVVRGASLAAGPQRPALLLQAPPNSEHTHAVGVTEYVRVTLSPPEDGFVLAPLPFVYDDLEYTSRICSLSILQFATTNAAELSDTVYSGVVL